MQLGKSSFLFLCANVGQIVSTMTGPGWTFYHNSHFITAEQEVMEVWCISDVFVLSGWSLQKVRSWGQKQQNSETVSGLFWTLTQGSDHDWAGGGKLLFRYGSLEGSVIKKDNRNCLKKRFCLNIFLGYFMSKYFFFYATIISLSVFIVVMPMLSTQGWSAPLTWLLKRD